jgi:hypothetical protein
VLIAFVPQYAKAGTTAAAYAPVAATSAAAVEDHGRGILDDLARFGPRPRRMFLWLWATLLVVFSVVYGAFVTPAGGIWLLTSMLLLPGQLRIQRSCATHKRVRRAEARCRRAIKNAVTSSMPAA